jgi:UDPglucose--hexose-1-phosphate uridylyltransferase
MIWEERWQPLREEWIIVAAHRQNRPWNGETIQHEEAALPAHLPDCYLCPGNLRVSGQRNEDYTLSLITIIPVWGLTRQSN